MSPDAAGLILEALSGYSALLIGCGLGQAEDTRAMIERLLLSGVDLPATVVDADGLNTLARVPDWNSHWAANGVLTPHPGEMARLISGSNYGDDTSRLYMACAAAREWGKTVVLKGAHTVIANADGSAQVSPFANPGLATAGTGDVLAGAIVGLLSQGLELETAASLGVYLHGLAGESARERLGYTGMIASDLLPALPVSIADLR